MQIRADIALQAIIKSLTDTIIPAVDPTNRLAHEQVRLTLALLELVRSRLPLEYRYDRDELRRLLDLADGLVQAELSDIIRQGRDVLSRAGVTPAELAATVGHLRTAVGDAITDGYANGDAAQRERVMSLTLASAQEQQLRERSWLLMQGWETDPAAVPSIEALLSRETAA